MLSTGPSPESPQEFETHEQRLLAVLSRIAAAAESQAHHLQFIDHTLIKVLAEFRALRHYLLDPSGFRISETDLPTTNSHSKGDLHMDVKVAGVDLQILDDGKGVLYTLQPVNSAGLPVPMPAGSSPISASSSNPASLSVALNSGDTTGLQFLGSIAQPPVDAVGIVVTFSATLPNGTAISTAADPVDVVPDPNNPNNPTGFTVQESAV